MSKIKKSLRNLFLFGISIPVFVILMSIIVYMMYRISDNSKLERELLKKMSTESKSKKVEPKTKLNKVVEIEVKTEPVIFENLIFKKVEDKTKVKPIIKESIQIPFGNTNKVDEETLKLVDTISEKNIIDINGY
jgi:Na+-transporting methylmalonyl-CoA/oxaloacetate decarboxylase gamma subunit